MYTPCDDYLKVLHISRNHPISFRLVYTQCDDSLKGLHPSGNHHIPSGLGLIPNSRSVKAASVAANVAKPAAQWVPMASAGAPIEAPTVASQFRDAMGAVQAAGTRGSFEVWCLLALLNF